MTDTAAGPAHTPPAAPAPKVRRGLGMRTYLLAGCSIGGTLCASLAANADVNLVFVIASAVFGAVIVLLTAAPAAAPAVAAALPAPPTGVPDVPAATSTRAAAPPEGMNSIAIGITAGILSFIMNQIAQVAVGLGTFSIVGSGLPDDQLMYVTGIIGLTVLAVKTPFDLFVGAFHLSRARNVFAALGLFVVTYLFCYFIEQTISATMGASGLFNVATVFGAEALLWGLFYVIVVPTLAQAVGAFGARLAALLMRRRST